MFTVHPRRFNKIVLKCAYRHGFRHVGRNFASTTRFLQVNVGGIPFSVAVSDIKKFPGCFFQQMIKKKRTKEFAEPICIDRDGALFKFLNAYIVNGHLPRNEEGLIDLDDATLNSLKEEADFYGLEKLSEESVVDTEDDKRDEEKNEESKGEDDFKDTEDEEDSREQAETEDAEFFWENQPKGYDTPQAIPDRIREASDADIARVFKALEQDLKSFDTIILCLQHLYPECQTNPAFLKGGDRALYDILTRSSNDYEVKVVAATIYRLHDYEHSYADNRTQFALFSPTIMKRSMGLINESDKRNKKSKKENDAAALGRTKLVVPNNLDPDSLLDYTPFVQHTGNESQGEESVYIVAGLQVRRKV
eukprot:gene17836-20315_t